MKLLGRILLASSAIVLAIGAWIHTAGFDRMSAGVAKSDLNPFLGRGLKVLWLQDSTIAIVLAIVFAVVVISPAAASKTVIVMLAHVSVLTAALTYYFNYHFFVVHIFLVAGIAAILGGFLWPEATKP